MFSCVSLHYKNPPQHPLYVMCIDYTVCFVVDVVASYNVTFVYCSP